MIRSIFAVLLLTLSACDAGAQQPPVCDQREKIVQKLSQEFSEAPVASGILGTGMLLEVLVSPQGTWTIIVTHPQGRSCLFSAGDGWRGGDKPKVERGASASPLLTLIHEDHSWVRQPQFKTASGRHCCSEQHCQPARTGELSPIPGGWRHNPTGLTVTHETPGIYLSEDPAGRVFRCVYGNELCVFEGASG